MPLVLLTRRGNSEKKCFGKGYKKHFFFLIVCLFLKGGGNAVNYGCEINWKIGCCAELVFHGKLCML